LQLCGQERKGRMVETEAIYKQPLISTVMGADWPKAEWQFPGDKKRKQTAATAGRCLPR
jgi:hypothetical protein